MRWAALLACLLAAASCSTGSGQQGQSSPSPQTPTTLCFRDPPPDWAAAMSHVVATLGGVNFGPGAIDEARGVVYGQFISSNGSGIGAVDLTTGRMTIVSLMTASESGAIWMSYAGNWLVWAQGEDPSVLGNWTIQAWNSQTQERRSLANSRLPNGTYLTGELVFPVAGPGYVAWNQPTSETTADLRVYRFDTNTPTTVDSGRLSSPVVAGRYLVWAQYASGESEPSLRFADAASLKLVSTPPEVSKPSPMNYLAGSDDYVLWIANPGPSPGSTMTVDALKTHRVKHYISPPSHFLQFPMLAGNFLVWFGADRNDVLDLRTGAAFDIALPGSVAGAGDTIVVAKGVTGPVKGTPTTTTVSVMHPSRLSGIGACAGH